MPGSRCSRGRAVAGIADPGEVAPPGRPASPMPATARCRLQPDAGYKPGQDRAVAWIADPGDGVPGPAGITDAGYNPMPATAPGWDRAVAGIADPGEVVPRGPASPMPATTRCRLQPSARRLGRKPDSRGKRRNNRSRAEARFCRCFCEFVAIFGFLVARAPTEKIKLFGKC